MLLPSLPWPAAAVEEELTEEAAEDVENLLESYFAQVRRRRPEQGAVSPWQGPPCAAA